MPPPADIVKVAIEWPGANAQLIEMDQVSVKPDLKHSYTHTLTHTLLAVMRFILRSSDTTTDAQMRSSACSGLGFFT